MMRRATVLLVLLQASTACQVRVSEYVFPQPAAVVSLSSTIEDVLHVSHVFVLVIRRPPRSSLFPSTPRSPSDGAWSSTTMMVCVTVPLVLLQASTACQVLVSEYVFPQPAAVVSLSSTIEDVLHVSLVVGEVNVGEAGHSTVPSLPWPPIDGA